MPKSTNEYKLFKSDVTILEKAQRIVASLGIALPDGDKLLNHTNAVDVGLKQIISAGPVFDLSKPESK